jgi:hypothetical protein
VRGRSRRTRVVSPEVLDRGRVGRSTLEALADWVQLTFAQGALAAAVAVGERLLDVLYDDDLVTWRRVGMKHPDMVTLGELLAGKPLPAAYLQQSLRVVEQLQWLPSRAEAMTVPLSHHVALLPVTDRRAKQALFGQARREGWTARKLRAQIKERRPEGARTGRPADVELVAVRKRLRRALGDVQASRLQKDEVLAMPAATFERTVADLEDLAGELLSVARMARHLRQPE